jgi:nucleoid DNA-binding protein
MTRLELIDALGEAAGLTRKTSIQAVHGIFNLITNALEEGETVKLAGFGTFSVQHREARVGRNPLTGEPVKILARRVVKFSPAPTLRKSINEEGA